MNAHYSSRNLLALRAPNVVMDPHKLGAMHQHRLSFVRSLIRRMANQQWHIKVTLWKLSSQGFGTVIYRLITPSQYYHLVIFSNAINDEDRNDRVIAEKWDITFALIQGAVDNNCLHQLRNNVPLQEAGRNKNNVLVLARANKSVRVFNHLVDRLANGQQPDHDILVNVGYILRTTAVYGNGKFGIADFELLADNPDFNLSFSAQMCAVYILRQFSLDWVHFLAKQQGGKTAVRLSRPLQRYLGIGNATGLGMAPYLICHPRIIDQWMFVRETAIAIISTKTITLATNRQLTTLLRRAVIHLQQIVTIDNHQQRLNHIAISELQHVLSQLSAVVIPHQYWQTLLHHSQSLSEEAQEIIIACLLELYPKQTDNLEHQMNADETLALISGTTASDLTALLEQRYQWALKIDFEQPDNNYWFWYRSADKEEPRIGIHGDDLGEEKQLPLDIARQTQALYLALKQVSPHTKIATFLLQQPHFRTIARRTWTLGHSPMGDIQINILSRRALPIHLLRCKLAMLGATKFDPRSDRWLRVTFYQGAPLIDEIHANEWLFPILPTAKSHSEIKERHS
ncbi:hypothetical protein C0W42_19085 [Photobacterium kishitanii]|uniref:hypothetical protein n=1 Tax=Photobacterium kishitanii TaxID=318456 RepID=UPI000D16FB97|nr:hypothetical protein [Photobacterium kishitanii]PSU86806.1 hypothetical protein C0W42_19085 [Photobacterium kishitanii]